MPLYPKTPEEKPIKLSKNVLTEIWLRPERYRKQIFIERFRQLPNQ